MKASNARSLGLTAQVQVSSSVSASGSGDGQVTGKRFRMIAYSGERIRQWWSEYDIVVDLDSLQLPSQPMPILYDHQQTADYVAGRAELVRVEGGQLVAEGPVYSSTEGGRQVLMLAAEGHTWQASIGADPGSMDLVRAGDKVTVNGVEHLGPVQIARRSDLREISFVVIGAAKATSAVVARGNLLRGASMDFDTWVQSLGFDPAGVDETQRANLQKLFDAEYGGDGTGETDDAPEPMDAADNPDETDRPDDPTAASADVRIRASRQAEAADIRRRHAISEICASAGRPTITVNRQQVPLEAHAIAEGWTQERTELELLRARRPTMVDVVRGRDRDCTLEALQGAMILRAGGRLDHPVYQSSRAIDAGIPEWLRRPINAEQRQRAMEAAHRYSDMSMVDLCCEAIRLDGRDLPTGRDRRIQAAFSGSSLTNIFTTNINAVVLATYTETEDTTAAWTKESDVADFKTNERPRMTKGPALTKLPRGAEADHASRSDVGESYKIARYARQFQIDEQDIIDDRFNALSDVPVEMGLAAARLRPDLVYSILKANAALGADSIALFHSSHSNTDSSAALAIATLKVGATKIRLQQENSVNLNLTPTHLIVPATLDFTARELVASTTVVVTGSTDTVRGNVNSLQYLGLQIVSDSRLDNGVIDPSSGTTYSGDTNDWFLVASMGHTIEVAYLRGTGRSPQVRSFPLERGRWGVAYDIKMDIGAKALDYRALYRGQG